MLWRRLWGFFLTALVQFRNWLYDRGWLKSFRTQRPLISVGNITMGGTGKTPLIHWLVQVLQSRNHHPAILSKSYRANLKAPQFLPSIGASTATFGDESVLLKYKNPNIEIVAGPIKWRLAEFLETQFRTPPKALSTVPKPHSMNPIDVIVLDDGFQHRRLTRDMDIVLLDASVSVDDYDWPPRGRAREPIKNTTRAQVLIWTKWEQRNPMTVDYLISALNKSSLHKPIELWASQEISYCFQFSEPEAKINKSELKSKIGFAFCGLGNPQAFLGLIRESGLTIKGASFYRDHSDYNLQILSKIQSHSNEVDYFITTEKDAIKIKEWNLSAKPLVVAQLEYRVTGNLEDFYEKLDDLFR